MERQVAVRGEEKRSSREGEQLMNDQVIRQVALESEGERARGEEQ
jgi:hypothetical protein